MKKKHLTSPLQASELSSEPKRTYSTLKGQFQSSRNWGTPVLDESKNENLTPSSFPFFLPLLDYVDQHFKEVNFERTLVFCVQHILPTTYSLFEKLFNRGLAPAHLFVLGKCYSTNPVVFDLLQRVGVNVSSLSLLFDSHKGYDETFDSYVEQFIHEGLKKQRLEDFEKIIILDDGGHLLEFIHETGINHSGIIGIEQTSSGYHRLKSLNLQIPIINLARSWVKLKYETPVLIHQANTRLLSHCLQYSKSSRILIMGNGCIGNQLYQQLIKKNQTSVFDINSSKSLLDSQNLPKYLEKTDLIIGCTGSTSLPHSMHQYISPATTLMSLSSSDREFDAVHFRRLIPVHFDCHLDIHVNEIRVINCGFPCNFNRNYDTVDSPAFQITRALLLSSLIQGQAISSSRTGFIDLSQEMQNIIAQELDSNPFIYSHPFITSI